MYWCGVQRVLVLWKGRKEWRCSYGGCGNVVVCLQTCMTALIIINKNSIMLLWSPDSTINK